MKETPKITPVENSLTRIRKSRGITVSDLARRVRTSRQTIYAIESGAFVPNTEVALRLARELEVTVDELFSLGEDTRATAGAVSAELLATSPLEKGHAVRVCRVGSRWVSVPVSPSPYFLPEADGIVQKAWSTAERADLLLFAKTEVAHNRLVLAGCDPATSLLARMVEKISGVEIVTAPASSRLALRWLAEGKVHIAGMHLEDPATGEFNLPFLHKELPNEDLTIVTFARWEEGLVVAPGNPKHIRKLEHLVQNSVRFVNRESGSGSRSLLDKLLASSGIESSRIRGYDRAAYGHLSAAYQIVLQDADACLAVRSAANAFGLDFVPLQSERYDLVMRRRTAEFPAAKAFLDVLQRATLRRKLETLAGYDASQTGAMITWPHRSLL
ncbi:MAG: helix-turn-helix domain-containing protein [Bryobacterales bacterium]|nr:helix-turn-helix domain-containing protein [Bryobacterales bacterium]